MQADLLEGSFLQQNLDLIKMANRRDLIMSGRIEELYQVEKKDISKAGSVLADAFQHDPLWNKMFEQADFDTTRMFFEGSVRYCRKYGKVYATSEHLEGIAAWVPNQYADMTIWRAILCGSFSSIVKMGMKMARVVLKMMPIFEPLEANRRESMKGREYLYLMVVGVASEFQGRGLGGKLLRALTEQSDQIGIPLYLETTTERNVRMYERLGFSILNQTILPIVELPQWGMIREPRA